MTPKRSPDSPRPTCGCWHCSWTWHRRPGHRNRRDRRHRAWKPVGPSFALEALGRVFVGALHTWAQAGPDSEDRGESVVEVLHHMEAGFGKALEAHPASTGAPAKGPPPIGAHHRGVSTGAGQSGACWPSSSTAPVPRALRVLTVAASSDPTTPRARRSWRSGRRMPGSTSMMSASAARILLGPEASGPAPRARRVVTEIIVGARSVTQATNDAAGPMPSRAPWGRSVRHDRTLSDRRTLLAGPALPRRTGGRSRRPCNGGGFQLAFCRSNGHTTLEKLSPR